MTRLHERVSATTAAAAPAQERSICILTLSRVADDPRVRRHCDAFHRAGWNVVAVGLPGAVSPPPEWPVVTTDAARDSSVSNLPGISPDTSDASVPRRQRLAEQMQHRPLQVAAKTRTRKILRSAANRLGRLRYRLRQLGVRIWPRLAHDIYWSYSSDIADLHACAGRVKASVWLANDWTTLPIAARLARLHGGIYGYDTHEFAVEEYGHQLKWRLLHRPTVRVLEAAFIREAAVVSAVSSGIAQRLREAHSLTRSVLTVRNTPALEEVRFHPTGDRVQVLYHGIIAPNRGLEAAIESVSDWRPEFDLTIRGPAEHKYLEALRQRIENRGLIGRVRLAPPVPMTRLVQEAAPFDVGLFALPGNSRHNEYALPNKFFEYIMAGLALSVTDLPEMGRLVRQYQLGTTIQRVDAAAIAEAINRLDRASIDRCKRRSLAAARELCWECESERLVTAYETALKCAGTAA